jgi:hypothetical protein
MFGWSCGKALSFKCLVVVSGIQVAAVQAAKVHFLRKLIFESRPNFGYFQIFF